MKPGNQGTPFKINIHGWKWGYNNHSVPSAIRFRFGSDTLYTPKNRRKLLNEFNILYHKKKITKDQWFEYRIQVRLGTNAEAEVIEAVIKVFKL